MIYFIRDPAAGLVKIGYSRDPWKRLSQIQISSASVLSIEAVAPGEKPDEAALHRRFSDQHVRGEWFRWAGPVASHVGALASIERPRGDAVADAKKDIRRAVRLLGFANSYASLLASGKRRWPIGLAAAVWQETGHKVGALAKVSESDLAQLPGILARGVLKARRAA